MSDSISNKQLYEELERIREEMRAGHERVQGRAETYSDHAILNAVVEIKREVRWLIVASVGLNQLFGSLDISSIAKAGIIGGSLIVGKVVLAWFYAR